MTLLSVQNLGKAYRTYRSEWRRFAGWFGLPARPSEECWVLRHISFDIRPGEAIGIMGQNGAGKSTLLKMIAGTLQPTEGTVHVKGRTAAILELGMGFNPELTGRQNVLHSTGLMGYGHKQIMEAMPDIEAFAEIGEYFDQPVRTYSSGMQVRVAFAVATAFRPEILIVDEALSVGDTYFQHKSFERIRKFQKQGTTLLIVTHDPSSILALCTRTLLLENGTVIKDGPPEEVIDLYNAIIAEKENSTVEVRRLDNGSTQTSSGTGEAKITEISLRNIHNEPIEYVTVGEDICLCIKAEIHQPVPELVLGYVIKDRLGQQIYGTNTFYLNQTQYDLRAGEKLEYRFRFPARLGLGSYSVSAALHIADTHLERNYHWLDMALMFNIVNTSHPTFVGVAWMPPHVECRR
ncbi:lipopolysaccharide transport system ATP-binding protein [Desulfobotulus alkaliphilus]|uniref:Lipopolysaccharide transport system ATP-binding protein n=1 Tax=Desulfobotulus alkaliphilus TaxID=622671 RepID=A0A562RAI2_9BACT|nr:ABC transporter ATP-binding protein [Desulfobotulus alkaliphilus]TWI66077.1 lipopolysaccharide transport system ATP-binding protein [Desulfobotulus alkaliphilus]